MSKNINNPSETKNGAADKNAAESDVETTSTNQPINNSKEKRPRRKRGIMRSFFSHIIFAALSVVAVGGYFHWEDIQSQVGGRVCAYEVLGRYGSSQPVALGAARENTAKPAAVVEPTQPTQAPPASTPPARVESGNALPAVVKQPAARKVAVIKKSIEQPVPAPSPVRESVKVVAEETKTPVPVANNTVAEVIEKNAVAKPASIDSSQAAKANSAQPEAEPAVAAESAPVLATEPSKRKAVSAPAAATTENKNAVANNNDQFETEWRDARRAYWAGDEGAEKSYLNLVQKYPEKADIRGELGNIYVKSGNKSAAASQFYQAGLLFIKSKHPDRAESIIELLNDLDPAKAENLKQALAKAG